MNKHTDFVEASIKAMQEIYQLIRFGLKDEHFEKSGDRGAGGDKSAGIDLAAEGIFIKYLKSFGQILSEECGVFGEGKDKIIIDPIDGSDNFLSRMPYFGACVALEVDGVVEVGIVANFANGDIFVRDDDGFRLAKLDSLDFKPVVQNHYSTIGLFERAYKSKHLAKKLKQHKIKYRAPGAVALSLAYASYVDFVIYEGVMRDYDIKAALFLCKDLYIYQDEKVTLVCKDIKKFDMIKKIVLGEE